jgi:hypothetical protein
VTWEKIADLLAYALSQSTPNMGHADAALAALQQYDRMKRGK